MTWLLAVVFKPLACALVALLICAPVRWSVQKYIPEGRLKRFLLIRVTK